MRRFRTADGQPPFDTLFSMPDPSELEARITALETRVEEVAADAAGRRRLHADPGQARRARRGQQQIVGLLNTLIDQPGESG
jgi:hypothetical protein